ncbi:C39 family peptidase [Clostridiaceae bacterium M8S5]|nr:C39 family peptidase [Clostridiaceae bacterium M8S5]
MSATIFYEQDSFTNGVCKDIVITESSELQLADNVASGVYESEIISTDEFKDLVVSWNSTTYKDTYIEVKVSINVEGDWSNWLSYGRWSSDGLNIGSEKGQNDEIAKLNIDVVKPICGKAKDIKFRVELSRNKVGVKGPSIRFIAFTMTLTKKDIMDREIMDIDIAVPARSQLVVPEIGGVICSPTSLSMVMEYLGVKENTERVAKGCRDNNLAIYGNWSYNVAYAGEKGFRAYVKRCSIEDVHDLIKKGIPLVASIKTNSKEELEGSVQSYISGHLIVIRGFENREGEQYIIVNDPASPPEVSIKRYYKVKQFEKAWKNIVYVLSKEEK